MLSCLVRAATTATTGKLDADTPTGLQYLSGLLLGMHADPEGRKILTSLRINRFVVPDDGLFESVREASKAWEAR